MCVNLLMLCVYLINEDVLNVFVMGCNFEYVVVVVMMGILCVLLECEMCGVMVYEFVYVKYCDILILMIIVMMVGVILVFVNFVMFFGGCDENGWLVNLIVGIVVVLFVLIVGVLI